MDLHFYLPCPAVLARATASCPHCSQELAITVTSPIPRACPSAPVEVISPQELSEPNGADLRTSSFRHLLAFIPTSLSHIRGTNLFPGFSRMHTTRCRRVTCPRRTYFSFGFYGSGRVAYGVVTKRHHALSAAKLPGRPSPVKSARKDLATLATCRSYRFGLDGSLFLRLVTIHKF